MDDELVHLGGEPLTGDASDERMHRLDEVNALATLAKVSTVVRYGRLDCKMNYVILMKREPHRDFQLLHDHFHARNQI